MSFSDVSGASKYFVQPNEGFSTTTSATTSSGATTVGLNSVSGLTNGTTFVGVIEPAGTKEQIFTGVVDTSGSQITGVAWTKGSNTDHAAGVSVVDYDTGTALKLMTTGLLKEHTQTGTHAAVTATSVTASGALTGTSLVNAAHTHANTAGGGQIANAGISGVGTEKLTNPYKFSVYRNTAWTASTPTAPLLFDTKVFDTGNNVDVVTNKGRFTAPIAGFYWFSAAFSVSSTIAGNGAQIALNKNGSAAFLGNSGTTSTGSFTNIFTVSGIMQLAASDYVEVSAYGSGMTGGTGATITYFMGYLVSVL